MITVWSVGLSHSLDRDLRSYRVPPADSPRLIVADAQPPIRREVARIELADDDD